MRRRNGRLEKLTLLELLDEWYVNLKKSFTQTGKGIIVGDEGAYRKLSKIDDEIRKRHGKKKKVGHFKRG